MQGTNTDGQLLERFRREILGNVPHLEGAKVANATPMNKVMAAIKECHRRVHAMGRVRISSTLKVGSRTDRVQSLTDKVARVEALLAHRP